MLKSANLFGIAGLFFLLSLHACRPYHVRQQKYIQLVQNEQFALAEDQLESSRKAKKKEKHKLLYVLDRGYAAFQQGKWSESSEWLMKADRLTEDYRKQLGYDALSLLVNANVKPYKAEDFEVVLMHYFHTIAFLKQRNFESALVECRRMNNSLSDMYFKSSTKPKYKDDAFGHLLMGLTYEGSGDINNAFIAYRNAYEIYKSDYSSFFETLVPNQLKEDLVRTASALGFRNEADFYRKEFKLDSAQLNRPKPFAEAVIFWQNGLGPIKEQWSIDFVITQQAGFIQFNNAGLGLNFAFPLSNISQQDANNLSNLKVFRIAFPKYISRAPIYQTASASSNGESRSFQLAEPIEKIAFKSLSDRFSREMGLAILRLAIKKATEYAIRQENKEVGALMGIANTITEQADTRYWSTLPATISYLKIPLKEGENKIVVRAIRVNNQKERVDTITIDARKGRTYFEVYNTIKP
jgi:hypothetical protein